MTNTQDKPTRLACRLAIALAGASLFYIFTGHVSAQTNSQQIYLQCLTNWETYAETIWTPATYAGSPPDSGYWGDGGNTGNGGIRGNGGVAVAYAVLVMAEPNSPNNPTRLAHIRQALNYNAGTHASNTNYTCVNGSISSPSRWGWDSGPDSLSDGATSPYSPDWQSSEWTGSMGLACLLMQSNLPAATVQAVQAVVASEATHRATLAPGSGYIGDTIAEENGWDGNSLALAAAWMSTDTNATNWLTAAKKYLANTYTIANTNGDPLASWVTTVTTWPSWSIQNHGFYYPVYEMVAGMSMGDSLIMAQLADTNIAAQLQPFAEHNVLPIWTNNLQFTLFSSGEFAYPAGIDWELHDYEQDAYIAWLAAHFNDARARWADGLLAQAVQYRQNINGDGMFVGPSVNAGSGSPFFREAVEARRTAIAWLQWVNADYPAGPTNPVPAQLAYFDDVDVLVQRDDFGFCSLSFGTRIMATVEAPPLSLTNAYVTTPLNPGIIGLGALGNATAVQLVSITTNADGFDAELTLTNGANGTTEVYMKSTGETVGIVEVPWPAAGATTTVAGSFNVGIENDPLTGGSRLLEWATNSVIVTNRSGVMLNISNNWLCVAGRYGMTAGPAGYFNYQVSTSYNIAGAAQDTLQFYATNLLAPRYAVWFPGKSALQTSNLAAQISWVASGTNGTLIFPGLGGAPTQINAVISSQSALSSYPPYELGISNVTASSSQAGYPPTNAVDNNLSTFWVSSGITAGQGPTPANPEWLLVNFPRKCAVSEFQVVPRTANGGYGPANVQLWLNGLPVATNTMTATGTLDMKFSPPLYATNAELYITGSYYHGNSVNAENVQVEEFDLFERALPGTFADWLLQNFTDTQLTNPAFAAVNAEPAGDGVPNLLEFAVGGNPIAADATNTAVRGVLSSPNQFAFQFHERNSLGDALRQFQSSGDLLNWSNTSPNSVNTLQNFGNASILQAVFPMPPTRQFFRIQYYLNTN